MEPEVGAIRDANGGNDFLGAIAVNSLKNRRIVTRE
jgi:hypothetical protein